MFPFQKEPPRIGHFREYPPRVKLGWALGNTFKSDISITLTLAAGQSLGSLPCMQLWSRAGSRVCVTSQKNVCVNLMLVTYKQDKFRSIQSLRVLIQRVGK